MKFYYKGYNSEQEKVKGTINSSNREEAYNILTNQKGYVSIIQLDKKIDFKEFFKSMDNKIKKIFLKINLKSNKEIYRQDYKTKKMIPIYSKLVDLIDGGVSIVTALEISIRGVEDNLLKEVFQEIIAYVKEGNPLSEGMEKHPNFFSDLTINLIKVGEENAELEERLEDIKNVLERKENISSEVNKALLYPKIIVVLSSVILVFISKVLFPIYSKIFSNLNVEFNLFNVIMFAIMKNMYLFVVVAYSLFVLNMFLRRYSVTYNHKINDIKEKIMLKTPVVKSMVKNLNEFYYTEVLGTLIGSGVNLIEALILAKNTVTIKPFQEKLESIELKVENGVIMSEAFAESDFFDIGTISIIEVGETSGTLDKQFKKISQNKLKKVEENVSTITTLIEPLAFAGIVIIIVPVIFSLILPMVQVYRSI